VRRKVLGTKTSGLAAVLIFMAMIVIFLPEKGTALDDSEIIIGAKRIGNVALKEEVPRKWGTATALLS
jgi:hypothetical protein